MFIYIIACLIIGIAIGKMHERSQWAKASRTGAFKVWNGLLYKVKQHSDSSGGPA